MIPFSLRPDKYNLDNMKNSRMYQEQLSIKYLRPSKTSQPYITER